MDIELSMGIDGRTRVGCFVRHLDRCENPSFRLTYEDSMDDWDIETVSNLHVSYQSPWYKKIHAPDGKTSGNVVDYLSSSRLRGEVSQPTLIFHK